MVEQKACSNALANCLIVYKSFIICLEFVLFISEICQIKNKKNICHFPILSTNCLQIVICVQCVLQALKLQGTESLNEFIY